MLRCNKKRFVNRFLKFSAFTIGVLTIAGFATLNRAQETPKAPSASYIFLGTVTGPAVKDDKSGESVYTVRVDQTYFQGGAFDDQKGLQVELTGDNMPTEGQFVFHTEPYCFGKRIKAKLILIEKPRLYPEEEVRTLKRSNRWNELQKRVKGAEFIVIGQVTATREWSSQVPIDSEHNPHLKLATIKVEKAFKGGEQGKTYEFLFAASDDIHWYRAPKPGVGKSGLFLFRRGGDEHPKLNVGQLWTLFDADDLLTGEDIEIVRSILNEGGVK